MRVGERGRASFTVEGLPVGGAEKTLFVAEVGNNHNGDVRLAKRLVEEAAKAGAVAVKFQKRDLATLHTRAVAESAEHRFPSLGGTYGEYRRAIELELDELREVRDHAAGLGLVFFATPFDLRSAEQLAELGVGLLKIASFDVTNLPMLQHVSRMGLPLVLSTGMSTLAEIDRAVETILAHESRLILLHCVSAYPAADTECNVRMITSLRERYHPIPVGYSGHERGTMASLLAVALGACLVERHLTLSRDLPGPDHDTVSLLPEELAELIVAVRRAESILGTGRKTVLESERRARERNAKSVVTRGPLRAGTVLREAMLACKCPGTGFPPAALPALVGRRLSRDVEADAVLTADDLE